MAWEMVYPLALGEPFTVLAPICNWAPLGGSLVPAVSPNARDLEPKAPLQPQATSSQRAEEWCEAGNTLREHGYYPAAIVQYDRAIALQPDKGEYHFLRGVCDVALGNRDSAFQFICAAVRLKPDLASAHDWLSQLHLEDGQVERAMEHGLRAYQLAPSDGSAVVSYATVLEAAGEFEQAWNIISNLLKTSYATPKAVTLFARMAPHRGERVIALEKVLGLLKLETHSTFGKAGLHFAAAELLDGMGRYDDAFAHAKIANQLKRPKYNPADLEEKFSKRMTFFTREHCRCLPKATYRGIKPVFIVGMPRSGTSLVEQILASHPQVHGAGELDLIYRIIPGATQMMGGSGATYPDCLDALSIDKANGLAQLYLEPLAALSRQASRIADKMPLNFIYLGLISVLFPEAKVIHCRRDPMDTCLSCYMTNFANANQFCFDLSHLGRFYRQYERLMAHWKSVLDLPILDVSYEQVVEDPGTQSRRLLDFLELPWDDRCLRFYETRRFVGTASVEQVRKPIYRSSIGRWRNYDRHLGELATALNYTQE